MRDDFVASTKDLLARRVGFKCSNLACRQPTSGPQADESGAVSIGVAAHITAASPDGPRYDPSLTPEQRTSPDNGIWLCQNHGKLVDNDRVRYTVDSLRDWKERAEAAAEQELRLRLQRFPDRSRVFERMERLMPALLAEMRQDLASKPLRREVQLRKRRLSYGTKGNELLYYYEDHEDLDDKLQILQNENLAESISSAEPKQFLLSEELAEYLGAP